MLTVPLSGPVFPDKTGRLRTLSASALKNASSLNMRTAPVPRRPAAPGNLAFNEACRKEKHLRHCGRADIGTDMTESSSRKGKRRLSFVPAGASFLRVAPRRSLYRVQRQEPFREICSCGTTVETSLRPYSPVAPVRAEAVIVRNRPTGNASVSVFLRHAPVFMRPQSAPLPFHRLFVFRCRFRISGRATSPAVSAQGMRLFRLFS